MITIARGTRVKGVETRTYVISDFFKRGPVVEGDAVRVVVLPLAVLQGRWITGGVDSLDLRRNRRLSRALCGHSLVVRDEKPTS